MNPFTFQTTPNRGWLLRTNNLVFIDNVRSGIGIPEPTTFGLLSLAAFAYMVHRPRRRPSVLGMILGFCTLSSLFSVLSAVKYSG